MSILCFQIKLRGFLSHVQQLRIGYWGISSVKAQSFSSFGLPSPHSHDSTDDDQRPAEASGVGRSWVQSMFSRDTTSRTNSLSRVRKWTSDSGNLGTLFVEGTYACVYVQINYYYIFFFFFFFFFSLSLSFSLSISLLFSCK